MRLFVCMELKYSKSNSIKWAFCFDRIGKQTNSLLNCLICLHEIGIDKK